MFRAGLVLIDGADVFDLLCPYFWLSGAVLLAIPTAEESSYLLGLLAKIKCSICSNQLNL